MVVTASCFLSGDKARLLRRSTGDFSGPNVRYQCPMLGLKEDHQCCIAVKTEESKASIRQSIALNYCNIRAGIPLYNSAHFFPNSSAIFSAIIIVGALVFPLGMVGMIEASTTRKFSILWTRKRSSTTAIVSFPILHVPMV